MTGNETGEEAGVETRDDSGDGSWHAVGSVAGWQTATSLYYYAIFAATSFVRDAFSVSKSLVGLFLTAGLLGYTAFLFPNDVAVDSYGEEPVMVVGLLALPVALVGVTFAPPPYLLLLVTVALLGTTYSTTMPASSRGIVAAALAGSRNLAMGLKQVGVTVGSGASSLVIIGVAAVAAWQVGSWATAVFTTGYAFVFVTRYRGNPGTGRFKRPRLADLGSNHAYVVLAAAGLSIGASIFSILSYTILYVQDVVGTGSALAGGVLAAAQVTGNVGRIGAGSLADRLGGPRGATTVAPVQLASAVTLFSLLTGTDGSFTLIIAVFVMLGLTIHGSTGISYSCLNGVVDDGDIGTATVDGQTALSVGGLVAPPLFGFVVRSTGYGASWALVAGSTVLVTVLLFVVRRRI